MGDDQKEPLIQLVYVSASTVDFDDEQLDTLLEKARKNNTSLDVTGVLLFVDGTFFQVLEGEEPAVTALYDRIATDTRHNNVLVLAKQNIEQRNFGEWSMGFVRDQEMIQELPGFVDFFTANRRSFLDLQGDAKRVNQIIDGFRRGRWRRQPTAS